ncbi:hypothetical protein B9W73_09535 [Lactococcus lactis]|uniref:hypothetical protein n=1 Tax=Lactococcus lactis TaxID=1358 RepID=UPI000A1F0033|nr:hypothetical protein [Lactococcus lactis]OSP86498.1 hypothetical protein B9W73_09535 [Lactococcus lactis]
MSQELYVIVDEHGEVARKVSGGHKSLGVFVSKKQAEKNFWRYTMYSKSDEYKIVKYHEVIE